MKTRKYRDPFNSPLLSLAPSAPPVAASVSLPRGWIINKMLSNGRKWYLFCLLKGFIYPINFHPTSGKWGNALIPHRWTFITAKWIIFAQHLPFHRDSCKLPKVLYWTLIIPRFDILIYKHSLGCEFNNFSGVPSSSHWPLFSWKLLVLRWEFCCFVIIIAIIISAGAGYWRIH